MNIVKKLAMLGGKPIRNRYLSYTSHWIDETDIKEVVSVLRSDWVTQGPMIEKFETTMLSLVGAKHAVAVNSCTAALHLSLIASGIKSGDEVITSPMTFAATSNAVLYTGAKPVFVDIDPQTMNIDTSKIKNKITKKTKAILPVHYGGQPCDMDEILEIAEKHGLAVIEDAAHAIGAKYKKKSVGIIGDATCFSFHAAKNIISGEGGMITTNDDEIARIAKLYRSHGISKEVRERYGNKADWFYEMLCLGYNYRITDIQASLAISQMRKLEQFQAIREKYVEIYNNEFSDMPEIVTPHKKPDRSHAWHIYVIQIKPELLKINRDVFIKALRAENIGANVHYIPVYRHPYYKSLGYDKNYPKTEYAYGRIVTLPLFPKMSRKDVEDVIGAVKKIVECYRK